MQFYVTKYYFLHKKTAIIKIAVLHSWLIKQIYKRSSVFDNHLSRLIVTNKLERPTYRRMRATSLMPYLGLAPGGVYTAQLVTQLTVSSYLAFSSLPQKWRLFSVALSLGSLPLGVTQHPALWSSDFPHAAYAARDYLVYLISLYIIIQKKLCQYLILRFYFY